LKAKVFKTSIEKTTIFPPLPKNFEYFIENKMNSKILEVNDEHYSIEIPDSFLVKQQFRDKVWYQSGDKKFGLFSDNEDGWKVLFQR